MTLDPVYKICDGAGRRPGDIQSGCGVATATDSAEIIGGAAATVGIAAGGVGLARGFVAAPVGPTLSVGDIMSDPQLLSEKTSTQVQAALGDTPGWRVEALAKGSQEGNGWVLRQYSKNGNPTGPQIRWRPGGGHHGPDPYWRVDGPNGDLGGIVR